jgi:hypothetical protein
MKNKVKKQSRKELKKKLRCKTLNQSSSQRLKLSKIISKDKDHQCLPRIQISKGSEKEHEKQGEESSKKKAGEKARTTKRRPHRKP